MFVFRYWRERDTSRYLSVFNVIDMFRSSGVVYIFIIAFAQMLTIYTQYIRFKSFLLSSPRTVASQTSGRGPVSSAYCAVDI